jgi:hypothetical protein
MMTDSERKLFDQVVTLTTALAASDSEAKTYHDWFYSKCDEVKKLEAQITTLKAELSNLRETGTIVVHDKPNPTYDGHALAEIQGIASRATEAIDALSGTQEG